MEITQWLFDLMAILSYVLVWLPLFVFFILLFINFIYCSFKSIAMKKSYEMTLNDYDKEVIRQWKINTDYALYKHEQRKYRNEAPINNKH